MARDWDGVETAAGCPQARGSSGEATARGWRKQQDVRLDALVLHLGALAAVLLLVHERPVEHQEQPTPRAHSGPGDG